MSPSKKITHTLQMYAALLCPRLFLIFFSSRVFTENASAINRVAVVEAGAQHTCILTTTGGVKCWGSGGFIGDNTTTSSLTPVNVSGLTSGVSAISAGSGYTCAKTSGNGVKCWGANGYGNLGDNTTFSRTSPVDVSGLTTGVSSLSAGFDHVCVVTSGGGAKCWGKNVWGELGDNTTTERHTPVNVSGLTTGVAAIPSSGNHTCALTTGEGVKCWGWNFYGQIGDNTTIERHTPVDVSGLTTGVSAVSSGGGHTCALTTGGGVKCWGANYAGQLGDNTTTQKKHTG